MDPLEFVSGITDRITTWYSEYDLTVSQLFLTVTAFLVGVVPLLIYTLERNRRNGSNSALALPPATEIVALYTYPIKSCRGIKLKAGKLFKTGLELDRQWMFVDAEKHEFLTIRQNSKMTLINTAISADDELVVTIKGSDVQLIIPAHPTDEWLKANTKLVPCKVWSDSVDGWEYDPALMKGFSEFFGQEVRLLRKGPSPRILRGNGAPSRLGREEHVGFADLMPVLVASESSIAEFNMRLTEDGEEAITIERFRPNIIVQGTLPWEEDNWKTIRLIYPGSDKDGDAIKWLTLDVVAHCGRCQVPNVNPETAEKHKREPWNHLMSYRRVSHDS